MAGTENSKCQFLTTEEFQLMTTAEKMDFLVRAAAIFNDRIGESWHRAFSAIESQTFVEHQPHRLSHLAGHLPPVAGADAPAPR